jgi:4-carboxymuconolactone decarboxylase
MSTADRAHEADRAETRQDRFDRGMEVLTRIDGEGGQKVVDSLADISPELGNQVVSWAFGDIYARPGLAPRDRQLVTLGMLTALGGCEPQLDVHINAALNVGLSSEEIVEALLHSAVYCGDTEGTQCHLRGQEGLRRTGPAPCHHARHHPGHRPRHRPGGTPLLTTLRRRT